MKAVCWLVLVVLVDQVHAGCDVNGDGSFDYFLIAIQWPPSFGKMNYTHWSIHGLWPSRDSNQYPCQCSNERFDVNELKPIQDRMEKYWPSLFGNSNEKFWQHEWEKHGTCSELGSQLEYFNHTLNALKDYDPRRALYAAGVLPSYDAMYTYEEIRTAFAKRYRARPLLGCHMYRGKQELREMGICLSKDNLQIKECDGSVERNRGEVNDCDIKQKISIPPFRKMKIENTAVRV